MLINGEPGGIPGINFKTLCHNFNFEVSIINLKIKEPVRAILKF